MMNFLIQYEHIIRPSVFIGLFVILAMAESRRPLANRKNTRKTQWATNLSLAVINTLCLKLLIPVLAVGAALFAKEHHLGLFNLWQLPSLITIIASLLLLDFIIYWQHLIFHKVPLLWKLHRVHHTEIGLDVSSAVRFHPLEMLLSMFIKMLFIILLGVPIEAVILFEVLLNALALFNHSNLKLPRSLDNMLRVLIVTPEVHWIHHSPIAKETNSNYGFNLIIWDKLFSTYCQQPTHQYSKMQQGLNQFGLQKSMPLMTLLMSPFVTIKKIKGDQ